MVNEKVLVKDKTRRFRRGVITIIISAIALIILFSLYYTYNGLKNPKQQVVLGNPLKNIIAKNTNNHVVNKETVIEQGILDFNADYINYLLVALGIYNLHKSVNLENPFIELDLGDEIWSSEIIKGIPNTNKNSIDNEDIKISINKEEAVKAILSENIEEFIKNSVSNGNIQIEMVTGKVELFSKGYLSLYKELTGKELN
jgi:hypothetical protein